MWYLKVSPNLFIAVALICMIQNAVLIPIDPSAAEDKWDTLAKSVEQNDLKKLSTMCKKSMNNFNEKLENMKTSTNTKLFEPNKTTTDIVNLGKDVKNQVKSASSNIVSIRKIVQKMALRFRDTFKSLESFTEIDHETINEKLKDLEKTTVDNKKPSVRNAIKSFGNQYDLSKLANKILKTTLDDEKLKDNYNNKRKSAKQEFSLLWNALKRHSKSINNDALETMKIFINGVVSVKSIKQQAKKNEEDALNEEKGGEHIKNIKNAVELAKAFKLKFKDEFELGSGEMTYSQEDKNELNEEQPDDTLYNSEPQISDDSLTNSLEPQERELDETVATDIDTTQLKNNVDKQDLMENSSISNNVNASNEEKLTKVEDKNSDEVNITQNNSQNNKQDPMENNSNAIEVDTSIEHKVPKYEIKNNDEVNTSKPESQDEMADPSTKNTNSNNEGNLTEQNTPNVEDINSDEEIIAQPKIQEDKQISKDESSKPNKLNSPNDKNDQVKQTEPPKNRRTKRKLTTKKKEKIPVLPWTELIKQKDPKVSNQSKICKDRIQKTLTEFDNIKTPIKNAIRNVKSYSDLENSENDMLQKCHDNMIDTSTKLADSIIDAADDVCSKVMPMNKRNEIKFKNDSNIKRIEYFLSKKYDPNLYISNILKNTKNTSEEPQKKTYNKMLSLTYNLKSETKEMEKAALYAMNKINEGKLAATDLKQLFNKEKASKACYIKKLLQEKENEEDKKQKEQNKKKIKENITDETKNKKINPNINLDSEEAKEQNTVKDEDEPKIMDDDEGTKTSEKHKDNNNSENIERSIQSEDKSQSTNNKETNTNSENEPESIESESIEGDDEKAKNEPKNINISQVDKDTFVDKSDDINEPKIPGANEISEHQDPNISVRPDTGGMTPTNKKPVRRVRKVKKPKAGDDETTEEYDEIEEVPDDGLDDTEIHDEAKEKPTPKPEIPTDNTVAKDLPESENPVGKTDDINEPKIPETNEASEYQDPNTSDNPDTEDKTSKVKKPVKRIRKVKKPKAGDDETTEEYDEIEEVPDDGSDDTEIHDEAKEKPTPEPENPIDNTVAKDLPESENPVNKSDDVNEPKIPEANETSEHQDSNISDSPDTENKTPDGKKPVKRIRKVKKPKAGDDETTEEYEEKEEVPDEESDNSGLHNTSDELLKSDENIHNPLFDQNADNISTSEIPVDRVLKGEPLVEDDVVSEEFEETIEDPDDVSDDSGLYEDSDEKPVSKLEKSNDYLVVQEKPEAKHSSVESNTNEELKVPQSYLSFEDHDSNISASPLIDVEETKVKKPNRRMRKLKKPNEGDDELEEFEGTEEVHDDKTDDSGIDIEANKKLTPEPENPIDNTVAKDLLISENPVDKSDDINEPKIPEANENSGHHDSNISDSPDTENKTPDGKKPVKRIRKVKKPKAGDDEITEEYDEIEEVPDDGSDDTEIHDEAKEKPIPEPENPIDNTVAKGLPETNEASEDQDPNTSDNPGTEDKTSKGKKPVRRIRKVKKPKDGGDDITEEYDEIEEVPDDGLDDTEIHDEAKEKPTPKPEIPTDNTVAKDLPESENPVGNTDDINEPKIPETNEASEYQDPNTSDNPDTEDKTSKVKKPVKRVRKVKKPKVDDEETTEEYKEKEEVPDDESDNSELHNTSDELLKSDENIHNPLFDQNADNISTSEIPVDRVLKGEPLVEDDVVSEEFEETVEDPDDVSDDSGLYEDADEKPVSKLEKSNDYLVVQEKPEAKHSSVESNTNEELKVPQSYLSSEDHDSNISASPFIDVEETKAKEPNRRLRKVKKPNEKDDVSEEYEETEEVHDDMTDDSGIDDKVYENLKTEPENPTDFNPDEDGNVIPKTESQIPNDSKAFTDLPDSNHSDIKFDDFNAPDSSKNTSSPEDQDTNITIDSNRVPRKNKPVNGVKMDQNLDEGDNVTKEHEEKNEVSDERFDNSNLPNISVELPMSDDYNPNSSVNPNFEKLLKNKKPVKRVRKGNNPDEGDVTDEYEELDEDPNDKSLHADVEKASDEIPNRRDNANTSEFDDENINSLDDISDDYEETSEVNDGDVSPESVQFDHSDISKDENLPANDFSENSLLSDEDIEQIDKVDNSEMAPDNWQEDNAHTNDSDTPISDENIPKKKQRIMRSRGHPVSKSSDNDEHGESVENAGTESGVSRTAEDSKVYPEYKSSDQTVDNSDAEVDSHEVSPEDLSYNDKISPDESFNHDVENIPHASDEVTNYEPSSGQEISEEYEESEEIDEMVPKVNHEADENSNNINPSEPVIDENSKSDEKKDNLKNPHKNSNLVPDDYDYDYDIDSYDNITNDKLPSDSHKYDEQDHLYDENIPYDDHEHLHETDNNELLDNSLSKGMGPSEEYEYPESSDFSPEDLSHPHNIDRQGNTIDPSQRKNKREPRLSRKPKNDYEQSNELEIDEDIDNVKPDIHSENYETMPNDDQGQLQENYIDEPLKSSEINEMEYDSEPDLSGDSESLSEGNSSQSDTDEYDDDDSPEKENFKTKKRKKPKKKKCIRRKKSTISNNNNKKRTITEEDISESLRKKKKSKENEDYSPENLEKEKSKGIKPKKKKMRRVRRIRRYLVDKTTNERIPIDDEIDLNTNQRPKTSKNPKSFDAENEPEDSNLDDSNMEDDSKDQSAFLFNDYNFDQCKRNAYDKFKKVKSEDTKEIAYRCVLDTSDLRSNALDTIKNSIKNVKYAKTSKDVDKSLEAVSYVLKTGLKQTINDLMVKVLPLINSFLQTTNSLKELYVKGPPSTHKMLSSILESEPNIPNIDEGILKLISPKFNVDELIDGLFKGPLNTKSLKIKKSKAQKKFMELSKNIDTAVSNIDCFVLSAMSTIGIGSNALNSLKSGRMIMSEKHPRTKALRDSIGIIRSLQKVLENGDFTPTVNTDNASESNDDDDDDDDEDPEQIARKNEEFLKTVPTLDDNVPLLKKAPIKQRSLGVIVVHPNKEVEYKEVTDTSELKKFVGDRTNKYSNLSQNYRPKFLKVNKKKLIDQIVKHVKKKAEKNGMSKKEMVDEIVGTLKKK